MCCHCHCRCRCYALLLLQQCLRWTPLAKPCCARCCCCRCHLASLLLQAPEVLEGDVASPTADVYAFGLVMWEVRWVTPGGWPALWGYCP
jgi:hypothetical protein